MITSRFFIKFWRDCATICMSLKFVRENEDHGKTYLYNRPLEGWAVMF